MAEHLLPESLRERRPIRILVIGAGGSGSQIFLGLPYLNQALRAWGHRDGLEITLMDGDTVSETNCIRQPFSVSDVGLNKASVLVNRVNLFWGLEWKSEPHHFARMGNEFNNYACDFIIGCVDSRAARRQIHKAVTDPYSRVGYWLDLGNNAASGQYLLGQPSNARNRRNAKRLRTISELYPEIIDAASGEDPLPSCSAIEALERQEPFINQVLAASSLAMLARLLHYGRLTHHGAFFNAATGQMSVVPVDPTLWRKTRRRSLASLPKAALTVEFNASQRTRFIVMGDGAHNADRTRSCLSPRSEGVHRPRIPQWTYRRPARGPDLPDV